jgi:hypothetical protein
MQKPTYCDIVKEMKSKIKHENINKNIICSFNYNDIIKSNQNNNKFYILSNSDTDLNLGLNENVLKKHCIQTYDSILNIFNGMNSPWYNIDHGPYDYDKSKILYCVEICEDFVYTFECFYKCPSTIYTFQATKFIVKKIIHFGTNEINHTFETIKIAITRNAYDFKYVENRYRTNDICKLAIKLNNSNINEIQNPSDKLKKFAVGQNCHVLREMKDISYDLIVYAVNNCGWAIMYAPVQDYELCKMAVKNQGNAFEFINPEFRTKEICELALKSKNNYNVIDTVKKMLVNKSYHQ